MTGEGLLIAQISDTHIGAAEAGGDANLERLDLVLGRLCGMRRLPDLLFVTGDLADPDEEAPYKLLKERLDACPFPVHVCLGNHDSAPAARQAFHCEDPDFFHYVLEMPALRIIVADTTEPGRHGGAFCTTRAAWLRSRLNEQPDRPTLIALHHPPIDTGIDWLTTSPAEPWLVRLDEALAGQSQVVAIIAGHIHRAISASRNGIPARVCPSIASPLVLDLSRLDPDAPDARPLVTDGPPGYALHLWKEGVLTSHVDFVQQEQVLARFDDAMQRPIRGFFSERP